MAGSRGGGFSGGGGRSFSGGGGFSSSGSRGGGRTFSTRRSFPGATHYVYINAMGLNRGFYSSEVPKRKSYTGTIILFSVILVAIIAFGILAASSIYPTKLSSSYVEETGVYIKDDAGIISDTESFKEDMTLFYEKTGIEPFVYTLAESDFPDRIYGTLDKNSLEEFAYDSYYEFFADEGHYMLVFVKYADGEIMWLEMAGDDTVDLLDGQAFSIFQRSLTSAIAGDEDFGKAVSKCLLDMSEYAFEITSEDKSGRVAIIIVFSFLAVLIVCGAVSSIRQIKMVNEYCDYQENKFGRSSPEL